MDTKKIVQRLNEIYESQILGAAASYFFKIESDQQALHYFGANHSRNPENEQYKKLKNYWDEFSKKTKNQNVSVLVEGGVRTVANNSETAIKNDSESGYITFLAAENNISPESPEPPRVEERQYLEEQFKREEIEYYYFARIVYQWNSMSLKPQFEDYIERFLQRDRDLSNWDNFEFSLENMIEIHRQLFDKEFDKNNKEFFYNVINPTKKTSTINQVARTTSIFRNAHIIEKIKERWDEKKNIFVVFGASHAIAQEPILKELLK